MATKCGGRILTLRLPLNLPRIPGQSQEPARFCLPLVSAPRKAAIECEQGSSNARQSEGTGPRNDRLEKDVSSNRLFIPPVA
jgi:hypothetical protein